MDPELIRHIPESAIISKKAQKNRQVDNQQLQLPTVILFIYFLFIFMIYLFFFIRTAFTT